MNVVNYLFENSWKSEKNVILGRDEEITYKELSRRVFGTARFLQEKIEEKRTENKKDKPHVIVMAKNSTFFIESYLGTILAGAICVPVDIKASKNKLEEILRITNAKHLFVSKKCMQRVQDFFSKQELEERKIILIEENDLESELSKSSHIDYQRDFFPTVYNANDEETAVIIFTSGSEGKQKGVMLSHRNIIANTDSIVKYLKLSEKDVMEVVLPFYYCYGTSLLHTHLRVGAGLVLNNKFFLPGTVIEDLNKYKCTGFAGVPSTFQILLRVAKIDKHTFPFLRYMTQAGGKLPEEMIKEMIKAINPAQFIVMYGQTEATARLSYLPAEYNLSKLGSIGKGIPGVQLEVLSEEGKQIKVGEKGELVAFGDNVMQGYFKDIELTAKILREGKLYTGDLATVDEEGFIYIVGRGKQILKVGGNRVSPKEIENVICMMPEVVSCAVIGKEDAILGEAIKTFVVLQKEAKEKIFAEDIKAWCKEKLETYKIPKEIMIVESLPTNSYGKVMIEELKRLK